jgi:hypothetical protein
MRLCVCVCAREYVGLCVSVFACGNVFMFVTVKKRAKECVRATCAYVYVSVENKRTIGRPKINALIHPLISFQINSGPNILRSCLRSCFLHCGRISTLR